MPSTPKERQPYALAVQPGIRLGGRYRVARVLGRSNPAAITYLVHDEQGGDQVVLKEFLPRALAGRAADGVTVRAHSPDDDAAFARSLRRFIREGELLADIAHPNLPRLRTQFSANGTGYLVFDHYEGSLLSERSATPLDRIPVVEAVALVTQALGALQALHAEGIVHGGVAPDNLLLTTDARIILLGLGTTRHVLGAAKEPTAGFAPIEQYASKELGPWTDVYACAAVLFHCVSGGAPPSAIERAAGLVPVLPGSLATDVPAAVTRAMMAGLAHLPDGRPHSADEFCRRLDAAVASMPRPRSHELETRAVESGWPARVELDRQPGALASVLMPVADEMEEDEPPPFADRAAFLRKRGTAYAAVGGLALTATLIVFTMADGRSDSDWMSGSVAPPAQQATPRGPVGAVTPPPVAVARAPQIPVVEPVRQQGGASGSRLLQGAPSRRAATSRPLARTEADLGDSSVVAVSADSVPTIQVSVADASRALAGIPHEDLNDLREQLSHGREKAEWGEYGAARRIFDHAMRQIARATDRYPNTGALLALRRDVESAADKALASCIAENEIVAKRNGKPLACE